MPAHAQVSPTDPRLTDARTPLDASVTPAKYANGGFPAWIARPWQSGRYYATPNGPTGTSNTLGNGTLRVVPFMVPSAVTLSRIAAEITVVGEAGSKLRLGIYAMDATGRPGALILDAGQIAADSATVQEITISQALAAGDYLIGGVVQAAPTTQPTVRVASTGSAPGADYGTTLPAAGATTVGYTVAAGQGALPANFGAAGTGGSAPRCFVKVA